MTLRHLPNDRLFELYDSEILLRLRNPKNLSDTRRMLLRFREYLGGIPPSPETAKAFLSQFAEKKPRTLSRYAQMIKAFMKWYGEPIDDVRVKVPKSLPAYVEGSDVDKLLERIANKKTHKGTVLRDSLLVVLAKKSGLRRKELSDLEAGQVHADFLAVRRGKGGKDRIVPLGPEVAARLHAFTAGMKPDERVFKLTAATISNKIKLFARKAGVPHIHTHSLRHKFATDLLEKGANVRVVQELLGHENLATTEVYLSVTEKSKREAILLLDDEKEPPAETLRTPERLPQGPADKPTVGEESLHEQTMRGLARELGARIRFPSLNDKELMDCVPVVFMPGTYQTPLGSVSTIGRRIEVSYGDPGSGMAAPHLVTGLYSHLMSSGLTKFADLVGDKGKLGDWIDRAGRLSEGLLTLLRLMAEDAGSYRARVCLSGAPEPGLTGWFVATAWMDALQSACGYAWIRDTWYLRCEPGNPSDLWQIRCGAYTIGMASAKKTINVYENWHKKLRLKYAANTMAKELAVKYGRLGEAGQEIIDRLLEFGDMRRLPGRCELC